MLQRTEIAYDIDDEPDLGYNDLSSLFRPEEQMRETSAFLRIEKDKALKYCIVASLALHLVLLLGLPRMAALTPTRAMLNPGESITRVRLVEPQAPLGEPEPPPKVAAAISDRDHTALKQRLPKILPVPRAPLGTMEAPEKRIASLVPPAAPEALVKEPKKVEKIEKEEESPSPGKIKRVPKKSPAKAKSTPQPQRKTAEYRPSHSVDLRPTPGDLARGLSTLGGSSQFFPDGEVEEAVVDINTREERFFSYLLQLKHKIQGVWVYPSAAARSGVGGSLTLEFSIARDGKLLDVNLLDSSGHTVLDESALNAIKTAAPYFPFPERLKAKRLRIRAHFIYVTSRFLGNIM